MSRYPASAPSQSQSRQAQPLRDVYVLPGEVRVATFPTRFLTILGSCVAVCLYDRVHGVGGLNHYLLPGSPPPDEKDRTRWSETAIDVLFQKVLAAGARSDCLEAKIFGGARISARDVPDALRIGDRNVEEAIVALRQRGIEMVNRSTGGNVGRKIIFESNTGVVWVRALTRSNETTPEGGQPAERR